MNYEGTLWQVVIHCQPEADPPLAEATGAEVDGQVALWEQTLNDYKKYLE